MNQLFLLQEQLLENISSKQRYLLNEIDWANRLIGIKGARGSGKTTLLLQYIKFKLSKENESLYTTLDDLYFLDNTVGFFGKGICITRRYTFVVRRGS